MSGSINRKETYKNLKKKGFVDSERHSGDHLYLDFIYEGKIICYTKVSHSGKDITGGLIGAMARQILLSKNDFVAFAQCTLTQEKYLQKLRKGDNL